MEHREEDDQQTLVLDRPILVGWSYGGFVISDYVRKQGEMKLAGGSTSSAAAVALGPKIFGTLIGPRFLENAPACRRMILA